MIYAVQSNVVRIDPRVYGNDGFLPGVAKDATNWATFFREQNIEVVGRYENTSKKQFGRLIQTLSGNAKAGDLAIIQHSGHGTQQRDSSGDELDGKDEMLCMFDGTLVDDRVWDLLSLFRPGVRVLLITDTCHSGTMYRSTIGRSVRNIDRDQDSEATLNCSLLAVGTCTDKQTAADTQAGGAGSSALLATYKTAADYRQWILESQQWLRRKRFRQELVLNEVNAGGFVQQRPFEDQQVSVPPSPGVNIGGPINGVAIYYANGTVETKGNVPS